MSSQVNASPGYFLLWSFCLNKTSLIELQILANTSVLTGFMLYSIDHTARGIGHSLNSEKKQDSLILMSMMQSF